MHAVPWKLHLRQQQQRMHGLTHMPTRRSARAAAQPQNPSRIEHFLAHRLLIDRWWLLRGPPVRLLQVTDRADVYSLGIIMNEMVTRRKPWEGTRNVVIAFQVRSPHRAQQGPMGARGRMVCCSFSLGLLMLMHPDPCKTLPGHADPQSRYPLPGGHGVQAAGPAAARPPAVPSRAAVAHRKVPEAEPGREVR